jgi:glycosyltransferase involved in cell wall biosynthesis
MACRVPAIATAVGGVPELIKDGVDGRLFVVGDVDGMARAAIELLSDGDDYEAMASAARQTAQQRYCASHIIPQYVDYYKRVLDAAP